MAPRLPKASIKSIEEKIDSLIDRAKVRFLGPKSVGKKLYIGFRRELSLPGVYEKAVEEEGGLPDKERLDQLINTASNYLDSLRHKAKANVIDSVQSFVTDSGRKDIDHEELETKLGGDLATLFGELKHGVRRVLDTETQKARNVGNLEGLVRSSAALGIEDPVMFFVIVRDGDACEECKTLHMLPDGKTPRVWKLSELGGGYHKRGDPNPKIAGLHPHCRCSLTTLLPGYGFTDAGFITYKSQNHDELERQRE